MNTFTYRPFLALAVPAAAIAQATATAKKNGACTPQPGEWYREQ